MKTSFTAANFTKRYGVSLFSGSGIGDLGLQAAGVNFLAMCEIESNRSQLAATNFPKCRHFATDVQLASAELCAFVCRQMAKTNQELYLLSCTAPCQGMSKNGQGTLLKNVREGKRPALDPRNRLILPALDIICQLRPLWVVFENVVEMRNTVIEDEQSQTRLILQIISERLAPEYHGCAYNVEFADYGVPQRRQRLITVYSRHPGTSKYLGAGKRLIPDPTHSQDGLNNRRRWVSVTEALSDFPPLDAIDSVHAHCDSVPFHHVPVLDAKKYAWVSHTPPGTSAFDNQCANPKCLFDANPTHGTERDESGINRGRKSTPLYCEKCGALLPRPFVEDKDGAKRIMSGFTSAYKRMAAALPAPALTRNLSYPCSDQKVHPFENRVLSLAEAMKLQSISEYPYQWGTKNGNASLVPSPDTLIRSVIGESIPPRFLEILAKHLDFLSSEGFEQTHSNATRYRVDQDSQMEMLFERRAAFAESSQPSADVSDAISSSVSENTRG